MANPSKEEVILYIKHDRSLTSGKNIYNRFVTKSLSLQQSFSRFTNSPKHIETICYELCKLVGLKDRQFRSYIGQAVTPAPVKELEVVSQVVPPTPPTREELLLALNPESDTLLEDIQPLLPEFSGLDIPVFEKGLPGNRARKAFLKEHNWEHTAKKKDDLDAEIKKLQKFSSQANKEGSVTSLLGERTALITKGITEMPDLARKKVKLWEQFPFLREKECPDEFKILVNDMITSYHTYVNAQPGLHDALTDDHRKAIAETVKENYLENKQIWEELEHYQNNKAILGEHPIFKIKAEKEKIKSLNASDLARKIGTLKANVTRNTQKSNDTKRTEDQRAASAILAAEQVVYLEYAQEILATR